MSDNNLRTDISKKLFTNREKLSSSSNKTYTALLFNLLKHLKLPMNISSFTKHKDDIIKFHETNDQSTQTNKTRLSALYVLTEIEDYKTLMVKLCEIVNDLYKTQKLNQKQLDNRISFDEVCDKVDELGDRIKDNASNDNYVNFILLSLMSGMHVAPRRSEYGNVKLKDYNETTDNYLLKNKIIFNTYKTSSKYGQQSITIPPKLMTVVRKWLKINNTNYLFTTNNKELDASKLNKKLNKIFDGLSISTNELRSIYLSNYYKDVPLLDNMERLANEMGHNFNTALSRYVKK